MLQNNLGQFDKIKDEQPPLHFFYPFPNPKKTYKYHVIIDIDNIVL